MIDLIGATDQPVRLWARTWQGLLTVVGLAATLACFVDLVLVYSLDLSDWAPAIWPICFVIWLFMLLGLTVEWTIAGHELRRRGWLSRPGREPSTVMELGPQVGIVHETRSIWRFRPNGYLIGVPPWQLSLIHI